MSAAILPVPARRPGPITSGSAGSGSSETGPGSRQTRLRITRRGRVVVTTLAAIPVIVLALVAGLASGGAAADGEGSGVPVSFDTITVEQGASLWGIAEQVAPEEDPREVIDAIVRLNGLSGETLEPGQVLALPLDY